MRAWAYSLALAAAGVVAASCGGSDTSSNGAGGAGTGATGGISSVPISCGNNPSPGDTCTQSGTCSENPNCFCLTRTVSCSTASTGGNNGFGGATNTADCGNNPQPGDDCTGGPAPCDNTFQCFCFNGQVGGNNCSDNGGGGASQGGFGPGGSNQGGFSQGGFSQGGSSQGGAGGATTTTRCPATPVRGDPCSGGDGQCQSNADCFCINGEVVGTNCPAN